MFTSRAIIILLVCFGVTATLSTLIAGFVGHDLRKRYHEVGIAVFLQLGVIYAVLLAFVFSEVWEQFNVSAAAVDRECSNLLGISERARSVDEPLRHRIWTDVDQYLTVEITEEWPAMQHRRSSQRAELLVTRLYNDISLVAPANLSAAAARERMLQLVADIHTQRQERLFQLRSNVPPFLWALLILDAAILSLFVMFGGIEHKVVHVALAGVFATFICGILLTIHLLDYPFEGTISISDEPLVVSEHRVAAIMAGDAEAP